MINRICGQKSYQKASTPSDFFDPDIILYMILKGMKRKKLKLLKKIKKFIFLYNQLKNDFVLYSEEVNKEEMKMKKVIGLLVMLVCFTGCASNGGVDYEDPSTFQEQNFASYEEWVDAELDLAQYYGGFTDDQLAYFREVAMQDEVLFREEFRRFNEEVESYLQQQDMIVQQQNELANQQQQQMFEQQQQMFDQQVQMSMGF